MLNSARNFIDQRFKSSRYRTGIIPNKRQPKLGRNSQRKNEVIPEGKST